MERNLLNKTIVHPLRARLLHCSPLIEFPFSLWHQHIAIIIFVLLECFNYYYFLFQFHRVLNEIKLIIIQRIVFPLTFNSSSLKLLSSENKPHRCKGSET